MLRSFSQHAAGLAQRWMPDTFVVAILMTAISIAAALAATNYGPVQTADAWGDGMWRLLTFTMQIVLTLALGHVAAHTRPVATALEAFAARLPSARAAYVSISLFSSALALISWSMALIAPAVLSRIIAQRCREKGVKVHFPLLVACGWLGSTPAMLGLSSTIALTVNTPGHFLEAQIGLIGMNQTIFTFWNLGLVTLLVVMIPLVLSLCAPRKEDCVELEACAAFQSEPIERSSQGALSLSERLETSPFISWFLALLCAGYALQHFAGGGGVNLNTLNMCFLALGLALSDSPRHFLQLLTNAGRALAPFIIVYPLYGGIMGVIGESGLGAMIVEGFVSVSGPDSLPLWTFFSAAMLNLFIPSAGGQWVVQGPIMVAAAQSLGADIPRVIMALVLGEMWTNAIQPIFALPVALVAGLHIRDIIGYGAIVLCFGGLLFLSALMFF